MNITKHYMWASDSGPPNHRNLMHKMKKNHRFLKKLGVPMPIGRSRLLLGVLGYGLGVPDCHWVSSAMDWAFPIAYWAFPITW